MEERKIFDPKFVHFMWADELKGKKGFYADTIDNLINHVERNDSDFSGQLKCKSSSCPFRILNGTHWLFFYHDPLYEIKWAWKQGKQIQYRTKILSDWWADCVVEPKWSETCEYRVKPETPDCYILSMSHAPSSILSINKNIYPVENEMILSKGTEEECKDYAVENYCKKCTHEVSICCSPCLGCQGFRELKPELQPTDKHVCGTCKYKDLPYSCAPCKECMEDFVDGDGKRSKWEQTEVKKRRWTSRELAQWVWQGNGQVKHRDGYYTLIACAAYDVRDDNKPCPDYLVIRGWDEKEWHEPEIEEE